MDFAATKLPLELQALLARKFRQYLFLFEPCVGLRCGCDILTIAANAGASLFVLK